MKYTFYYEISLVKYKLDFQGGYYIIYGRTLVNIKFTALIDTYLKQKKSLCKGPTLKVTDGGMKCSEPNEFLYVLHYTIHTYMLNISKTCL